jgi:hypothetical protein
MKKSINVEILKVKKMNRNIDFSIDSEFSKLFSPKAGGERRQVNIFKERYPWLV